LIRCFSFSLNKQIDSKLLLNCWQYKFAQRLVKSDAICVNNKFVFVLLAKPAYIIRQQIGSKKRKKLCVALSDNKLSLKAVQVSRSVQ